MMTSSEFVQNFIIQQAKNLQEKKAFLASLAILAIGLEIMGGFFDKKPLKSPKQSKARFRVATDKLLGGRYSIINRDDNLYELLRNQLLHSLLPGKSLVLDITENENHLLSVNNTILFNPWVFLKDVESGAIKLQKLMIEGKAFEKRIPDNSHEILKWIG